MSPRGEQYGSGSTWTKAPGAPRAPVSRAATQQSCVRRRRSSSASFKMAAHGVLSCLETFPTHMNPLDVLLDMSHLQRVFPDTTDSNVTLLFTVRKLQHHRTSRILLRCHPKAKESRVVVGARSTRSSTWARSARFTSGLQSLAADGQTLLAGEGDDLWLPYHTLFGDDRAQVHQLLLDLVVLSCSPVRQGRITAHTCVVVSDLSDPSGLLSPGLLTTASPQTEIFVSDFAHFASSLHRSSSLLANKKALTSGFPGFLLALEGRVDVRVANVLPLLKDSRLRGHDLDSTVFVTKNLLMKLGLFNHEWVLLSELRKPRSVEGPPPRRGRLASLVALDLPPFALELHLNDTFGIMSTTHWFNLSGGEPLPTASKTLRIKRLNEPSVQGSPSSCLSAAPQFASQLHVDLIHSAQHAPDRCYDRMLAHHFTTARLVSSGDVLAVSDDHYTGEGERWQVQFFKVKKVFGDEEENHTGVYLADKLHTSLYMGGSTSSLVPFCSAESSFWSSVSPAGLCSTVEQITSIMKPHLHHRSVPLGPCSLLLQGARGCGKMTAARAACRRLHLQLLEVQCVSVCGDTAAACEVKVRGVFQRAESLAPCVLLLRNLHLLRTPEPEHHSRLQAALHQLLTSCSTRVIVIATVYRPQDIAEDVMAAFVHQVSVDSPDEDQRGAMLASLGTSLPLGRDVSLQHLATHTAGLVLGDLSRLLAEAGRVATARLSCAGQAAVDLCSCGATIQQQDVMSALETLQSDRAQAAGAPKIPSVRWQEVGGLQDVKQEILNTVQLPLQRPELLALGLHRVGLLLYGPPGTGKTLLAKAVATECSMTFLSVKGPELINMFVGQSEENIREVFSRARSAAPCVVFFDELDSLAPSRGRSGDSGGVMDRVVSQLLAELDSLHSCRGVFVIGATNRPDLLDQALLRPGRFDKLVYVGINSDKDSQLQVLKAITAKFQVDPGVSLPAVVEACPGQLSGADLYALCSEAMSSAVRRKISLIADGLDTEESPLVLTSEDFSVALTNVQPSVSDQELLKYLNIQQTLTAK